MTLYQERVAAKTREAEDADKLSRQIAAACLAHINQRWTNHKCPMCEANAWVADEYTLGIEPNIVAVPVSCTHCGFTALVNPVAAGVIDKDGNFKEAT